MTLSLPDMDTAAAAARIVSRKLDALGAGRVIFVTLKTRRGEALGLS